MAQLPDIQIITIMMATKKTANKLATEIVGDGKKPNKWFVTIGYGWYWIPGKEHMVQAKNSLESVSILFNSKEDAEECFRGIPLGIAVSKVSGTTIGQVIIEDRANGVIAEKFIRQRENGTFYKSEYWD